MTVHGVGVEGDDSIQVTEHREPEDGVNSDIRAQSEGDSNRGARYINVGSDVSNDGSQIAVISSIKI